MLETALSEQVPQLEVDLHLVSRCIKGDAAAWSELYQRFHQHIQHSIRSVLGSMARDTSLVDEIGARIWYALVRNDCQLLGRFDVSRGCQLSTFLGVIAKHEAKQLLRSESRRRNREHVASRPDLCLDQSGREINTALEEEFLAILTPSERKFYSDILVSDPNAVPAQEYSQSNAWQLTHRVKAKLTAYLFDSEIR